MYFETMKPKELPVSDSPALGLRLGTTILGLFILGSNSAVPAELSPRSPVVQFLLPFNFHHFYIVLYLLILLPLVSKFRKGNISHLIHLFFLPVNSIIIVTGTQLVTELGVSVFTAI